MCGCSVTDVVLLVFLTECVDVVLLVFLTECVDVVLLVFLTGCVDVVLLVFLTGCVDVVLLVFLTGCVDVVLLVLLTGCVDVVLLVFLTGCVDVVLQVYGKFCLFLIEPCWAQRALSKKVVAMNRAGLGEESESSTFVCYPFSLHMLSICWHYHRSEGLSKSLVCLLAFRCMCLPYSKCISRFKELIFVHRPFRNTRSSWISSGDPQTETVNLIIEA